jgi:hypothetical protein
MLDLDHEETLTVLRSLGHVSRLVLGTNVYVHSGVTDVRSSEKVFRVLAVVGQPAEYIITGIDDSLLQEWKERFRALIGGPVRVRLCRCRAREEPGCVERAAWVYLSGPRRGVGEQGAWCRKVVPGGQIILGGKMQPPGKDRWRLVEQGRRVQTWERLKW